MYSVDPIAISAIHIEGVVSIAIRQDPNYCMGVFIWLHVPCLMTKYRIRRNFHSKNILCVKFSLRLIFVGQDIYPIGGCHPAPLSGHDHAH